MTDQNEKTTINTRSGYVINVYTGTHARIELLKHARDAAGYVRLDILAYSFELNEKELRRLVAACESAANAVASCPWT